MNKRFIGVSELAEYIGVSPKTIRAWVWLRKIPYHKLGRLVRFDLQEIEPWIQDKKIQELA